MKKVLLLTLMAVALSAQPAAFVSGTGFGLPSPGGAATIYGNFPGVPTTPAPTTTLPLTLGGVTVSLNGITAPLYYVSATQINVQVPWELQGATTAIVAVNSQIGSFPLYPITPGTGQTFVTDGLTLQGAILNLKGQLVSTVTNTKVVPGDVVSIYCTGLGPVTAQPSDGTPDSGVPLSYTKAIPQVFIGEKPAQVLYSGLAPGFAGLYQINAVVPSTIDIRLVAFAAITGEVPVRVALNGDQGNVVYMGWKPYENMVQSEYLNWAFDAAKFAKTVAKAKRDLKGLKFDAIAGIGNSGVITGAVLAYAMKKNFILCRKTTAGSHAYKDFEGELDTKRWLFVDDFVTSGQTMVKVYQMVSKNIPKAVCVGAYRLKDNNFNDMTWVKKYLPK